jgi:hypothetical protein
MKDGSSESSLNIWTNPQKDIPCLHVPALRKGQHVTALRKGQHVTALRKGQHVTALRKGQHDTEILYHTVEVDDVHNNMSDSFDISYTESVFRGPSGEIRWLDTKQYVNNCYKT